MKKSLFLMGLLTLGLILTLTCQQLFTWSPLTSLQRDPTKMTASEQVGYAEDVLQNGDQADMLEVLPLIDAQIDADPANMDLLLLGLDLAVGGSGLESGLAEAVATFAATGTPPTVADVNTMIAAMDSAALTAAADYIADAVLIDPTAIEPEQYVNAALAVIMLAAEAAGGIELVNTTSGTEPYDTIQSYIVLSGMDEAAFMGMVGL